MHHRRQLSNLPVGVGRRRRAETATEVLCRTTRDDPGFAIVPPVAVAFVEAVFLSDSGDDFPLQQIVAYRHIELVRIVLTLVLLSQVPSYPPTQLGKYRATWFSSTGRSLGSRLSPGV